MLRANKGLFIVFLFLPFLFLQFLFTIKSYAAPPAVPDAQVSEYDTDLDGIHNHEDECHITPPGEPINELGCSVMDLCPCNCPFKNHGEYVECVAETSKIFVREGWITSQQRSNYISEAANNDCPTVGVGWNWSDPNYNDYGDPDTPPIKLADDTLKVSFAVTGDPQFARMYEGTNEASDDLLKSQKTVYEINKACKDADPECMGVIVAGDLTADSCVQSIIAYRQLYEHDYPGEDGGAIKGVADDYHDRYSWDYRLNYPMYALIGNHDDASEHHESWLDLYCGLHCTHPCVCWGDHTCRSPFVDDYIDDLAGRSTLYQFPIERRISGWVPASKIKGNNYAWEWGSYHFISLGLWAFYDGFDEAANDRATEDQDKIDWLKDHLAFVGTEKAIVLFQHFGWDGSSFDGRWWSTENAAKFINVLCNRDSSNQPCGTPERPRYNVIGIFSGHNHQTEHHKVCAEYDNNSKCSVHFDNYIVDDAGPDLTTGFTLVELNAWPKNQSLYTEDQVKVTNYQLGNFKTKYDYDGSGSGTNLTTYSLNKNTPITDTITTGFLTWDQGEPNGIRWENCAAFKPNGRFNDEACHLNHRFVCRNLDSNELILQEGGAWHHGEFICNDIGDNEQSWFFSLPKNLDEQADLTQLIIDSGNYDPVWVNYSDLIEEDHWISYPHNYFYFVEGQPNDGSQLLHRKGRGEDCAFLNEYGQILDGQLQDGRCENEMHTYVCKNHNGWYLHEEKGMWKQGFDEDKCGGRGFVFPSDWHEFEKMFNKLQPKLEEYGKAWISLNDIVEEGDWVSANWDEECWGDNTSGQTTLPYGTFRQMTTGRDFTCGIQLDGTVKCWGVITNAPSDTFVQISAGDRHACGVRSNKTVACWGSDQYGETIPPTGNFHQVSAGDGYTCGVRQNHTVTCWGDQRGDRLNAPAGKFHQVSAGDGYTCGVRQDGRLACWGSKISGNVDPPPGDFLQVTVGENHACGVRDKLDPGEGYWELDEGTGITVADSSGNDYGGTLANSPTWSDDTPKTDRNHSKSLHFDRVQSDHVDIPYTPFVDNLSQLTLSTWVKLSSTPSTATSHTYMRFISLGNEKAVLRYHDYDGTGKLDFYMNIGGSLQEVTVDQSFMTAEWYHVAGTYDGGTMRLYINGLEQGAQSVSGVVAMGNGVSLSHPDIESLDGSLDDVRVYDRALSLDEIHALAAGAHPTNTGTRAQPQLAGYWKLDEGYGKVVDSSGNGYDGTVVNQPTWSSNTPGKRHSSSSSLSFDRADDDHVNIPSTTRIDNLEQLSLSTWVKLSSTPSAASSYTYMRFISLGNEKAALRYHDYDGTGKLEFYMNIEGIFHKILVDIPWAVGEWYHVTGTYDGSMMRLFLNGWEQDAISVSGAVATGDGVYLSTWGSESLDGLLDDVRIYDRALSVDEIHSLAAGVKLDSKGRLTCWGNEPDALEAPSGKFQQISAGGGQTCAVRDDHKLTCWGDNTWEQLDAPHGTWNQVSTGYGHACSINHFIRPWEDDFAPGEKHNEAEDCAYLHTYIKDGKLHGDWRDYYCDQKIQHYACRSNYTGEWRITSYGGPWFSGFNICGWEEVGSIQTNEFKFDVPATRVENKQLLDLIWAQFGRPVDLWLNYTDARTEGLWRHAYFEPWNYIDPGPEHGHCAVWHPEHGYDDIACDEREPVLCDMGYDHYQVPLYWNSRFTWQEGLARCYEIGGVMALPTNTMDYHSLSLAMPMYAGRVWVRFNDINYEGHWEDWYYDD